MFDSEDNLKNEIQISPLQEKGRYVTLLSRIKSRIKTKTRIRGGLSFRKPAFWVCMVFVVAICTSGVLLAASNMSPKQYEKNELYGKYVLDTHIYRHSLSESIPFMDYKVFVLSGKTLTMVNENSYLYETPIVLKEKLPFDENRFYDSFDENVKVKKPNVKKYRNRYEYQLCSPSKGRLGFRLYLLDSEIWLVEERSNGDIWKINRIKYFEKLQADLINPDSTIYEWDDSMSLPFPPPNTGNGFELEVCHGGITCYGSEQDLNDYIQLLSDNKWKALQKRSIYVQLIKDNDSMLIVDQTSAFKDLDKNHFRVEYTPGYFGSSDNGRKTKEQAKEILQAYINSQEKNYTIYDTTISDICELDIGEAYEKMGLQRFDAFSSSGRIGSYAIGKNNSVIRLISHIDIVTFDIDGDGEMELITACTVGSGMARSSIVAFKYDDDKNTYEVAYRNSWDIQRIEGGVEFLTIRVIDDSTLHLFGGPFLEGKVFPMKDYGELYVEGDKILSTGKISTIRP